MINVAEKKMSGGKGEESIVETGKVQEKGKG